MVCAIPTQLAPSSAPAQDQTDTLPTATVRDSRRRVIQEILDFFHDQVKRRAHDTERVCQKTSRSPRELRMCDSLILGEITRYLIHERLEVPTRANEVWESPDTVLSDLKVIFDQIDRGSMRGHTRCSPGVAFQSFEGTLRALWEEWEEVLEDGHMVHLWKRRRRLGFEENPMDCDEA